MILPIESIAIQLTFVDDTTEDFTLEAPNADDPYGFTVTELTLRGKYRDKNQVLRKGSHLYSVEWSYDYASHEMDLRKLLAAKKIMLKCPPNFIGDYTEHEVRFANEEAIKNYLEGLAIGRDTEDESLTEAVPSGSVTLDFELVHPLTWSELLELPWEQGTLKPSAPANFAVVVSDADAATSWDAVADVDGYNVYLSSDGGGSYTKQNGALITETEYTIENLDVDDYQAYVTAENGGVESDQSNVELFSITVTIHYTDFSNYADDAFPTGWKDIWHDSPSFTWLVRHDHPGFTGEAVLEHNQPSNEYDAIIWNELGQFTDFEILTFMNPWVGGIFFAGMQGGVAFRCSDTDNTSKQGYTLSFRRRSSATDLITLQKWVGNSLSSLAGSTAGGILNPDMEDIIYGVRILVEGERIRVRVWRQTDPEPEVWHMDVTDTGTVITTGYIGFTSSEGASGTNGQWDADTMEIKVDSA